MIFSNGEDLLLENLNLTPFWATILVVVAVIAGHQYRKNWKNEGPLWKAWAYGTLAGLCLLALGFIPLTTGIKWYCVAAYRKPLPNLIKLIQDQLIQISWNIDSQEWQLDTFEIRLHPETLSRLTLPIANAVSLIRNLSFYPWVQKTLVMFWLPFWYFAGWSYEAVYSTQETVIGKTTSCSIEKRVTAWELDEMGSQLRALGNKVSSSEKSVFFDGWKSLCFLSRDGLCSILEHVPSFHL